jgi:hypothetical protein
MITANEEKKTAEKFHGLIERTLLEEGTEKHLL